MRRSEHLASGHVSNLRNSLCLQALPQSCLNDRCDPHLKPLSGPIWGLLGFVWPTGILFVEVGMKFRALGYFLICNSARKFLVYTCLCYKSPPEYQAAVAVHSPVLLNAAPSTTILLYTYVYIVVDIYIYAVISCI